jgi:hypothetical protein
MKTIAVLLMSAAAMASAPPQKKTPAPVARVYVFTAETAASPASTDRTEREEAVNDLRDALGKKKGISIVDDQADADVKIEVLKCEALDMGSGGFGGEAITPLDEKVIHLHAVSAVDQADFKGTAPGYWNRAAKDAADRLEKWIERVSTKGPSPKR